MPLHSPLFRANHLEDFVTKMSDLLKYLYREHAVLMSNKSFASQVFHMMKCNGQVGDEGVAHLVTLLTG